VISKLGAYDEAINQYHQLARQKFENIYIKGTGYFISHRDLKGDESEAFVFKKIIQMTASSKID
jgi:hypothetical protein